MHNFKIACANLKDPHISSLRMNHFKIAHISTLLATPGSRHVLFCSVTNSAIVGTPRSTTSRVSATGHKLKSVTFDIDIR